MPRAQYLLAFNYRCPDHAEEGTASCEPYEPVILAVSRTNLGTIVAEVVSVWPI